MTVFTSLGRFCSGLIACGAVCLASSAYADTSHTTYASSHAPLAVMGDHLHTKGEFMFSYRYMRMDMEGSRRGTQRVSDRSVVGNASQPGQFLVVPTSMPMDMHMLGAMYGLSDSVTVMAMVSYLDNSMDHLLRNSRTFTTESSGLGDSKVSALIRLSDNGTRKSHLGIGLSLPTGSTSERDDTPAMANAFLPYPMQLGSGTYDLLPSITLTDRSKRLSWGGQASAVIRTGESDEGYTLGDRIKLTAWLARDVTDQFSVSARLSYLDVSETDGSNPLLNPRMVQTADTRLHSGQRFDASVGANFLSAGGHRFALEYSLPVSQDLDGPQLEIDSILTVGWQKAF